MTITERLLSLGITIPQIMVPGASMRPECWSVIACDQFSSEPSYWNRTRRIVGSNPSTLDMIIPECYLDDGKLEQQVNGINQYMKEIISQGILRILPSGFVLVERTTPFAAQRRGLMLAIDLDTYDFSKRSTGLIRPSEGTIPSRLPPRMAVRLGASLDIPHILLLMNDPEDTVMQTASLVARETVYDFELMQEGGHVTGCLVTELESLTRAFESLAKTADFLFAVGDGNHSLAAAKEIWKTKKAAGAPDNHPARFTLAEVINIHDAGLHLHPIHRILFDVCKNDFISFMKKELSLVNTTGSKNIIHSVKIISEANEWNMEVRTPTGYLAVEPIQAILDAYLNKHQGASLDYIHGEASVRELARGKDRIGILLPKFDKKDFFNRITHVGPYPRKSFSIGEAIEKRYYLESRYLDEMARVAPV